MTSMPLNLREAPPPLTRPERVTASLLALLVALSRWPAISRTLWDWDEALFALAVQHYDVTLHQPHPPGFPLFIALAKLIPLDPFHALQSVTVVASLLVFPAMFFLARELRFPPFGAMAAALLLAFFPNVWLFGGTALSDVPSLVLALAACALLLRGCRDDRALLAGALLLGIAAGFRPQNLLIGFVPFLLAFLHRRRTAVAGALLIALVVLAGYGAAASRSGGWHAYRAALTTHESYIRSVDSFLSPTRPGLIQVADDFFLRPYRAPILNVVITLLALAGLRRRRGQPWPALLPLLLFGPFLLFAWLYLDFHSSSRFSIAYMPLYALLAANGIPSRARAVTLGVVVALLIVWSWPALRIVHTTVSPPVAAMEAVRRYDRASTVVFVDERLAAHARLLVPEYPIRIVRVKPPLVADPRALLVREGESLAPGAQSFIRDDAGHLAGIVRKRYFAVSVMPGRRVSSLP
jgi:hypothetical protein